MLKIVEDLQELSRRFQRADIPTQAAALSFHTLLGIVPMIGLTFWYLKNIGVTAKWRDLTRHFILSHLQVGSSEAFNREFERITAAVGSKTLNFFVLALLLYTIWSLVRRFGDTLDRIVETRVTASELHARHRVRLYLQRGFILLFLPLSLMLSLVMSSWLTRDSWFHFLFQMKDVGPWLAVPIPVVIDIAALFLLYTLIPRRAVSLRSALRGAVLVAPLLEGTRMAVGYLSRYAFTAQKIYGAFAAIPLLIIWIQIAWTILLSGALVLHARKSRAKPLA